MIYLILGLLAIIYLLSLMAYSKVRNKTKSKAVEWVCWVLFATWTMAFILGGMSFIKNSYPDSNKVVAAAPVAFAFFVFIFIKRSHMSAEGFNKKDI